MSDSNVILVVGETKVGKRYIARGLNHHAAVQLESSSPSDTIDAAVPVEPVRSELSGIERYTLTLDTKYYTASVGVHVLPGHSHAKFVGVEEKSDVSASDQAKAEFATLEPQALLLVFSLHQAATFHSLVSAWSGFIKDRQPEVLMLVGNIHLHADTPGASEQDIADLEQLAKDWALEHQVEYVRLPSGDRLMDSNVRLAVPPPAAASARRSNGTADDDASDDELDAASEPTGLARMRESLECTPWPGAKMKPRAAVGGRSVASQPPPDAQYDYDANGTEHDEHAMEALEAAAFASMQQDDGHIPLSGGPDDHDGDEEKFEQFVGSNGAAHGAASTPTIGLTTAPTKSSASSSAVRSASASAFANAFANAIRVPDEATKSNGVKGTKPGPRTSNPSATAASSSLVPGETDSLDNEDMDALAEQLAGLANGHSAGNDTTSETKSTSGDSVDESGASFDKLFDRITAMKNELNRVRPDGTKMSDEERRAKAEENIKALLMSMGMDGELEDDDEDDDHHNQAAELVK